MATVCLHSQYPVPYSLKVELIFMIERVKEDRVVLYNVIDDLQRMHQKIR